MLGIAVSVAVAGGVSIAVSHMIARRLGDLGFGSAGLMGLRFPVTLAIAALAEVSLGQPSMRSDASGWLVLATAAFGLIVLPSFFLQLGVARTSPLSVNAMRALGPIFVFAVQQPDGRLHFSASTLACIVVFVIFSTVTIVIRAKVEVQQGQRSSIARARPP